MSDHQKRPYVPEEIFEILWEVNQDRGISKAELLTEIEDALIETGHTDPPREAMPETRCCWNARPD